jgi:hypothetical protein
MEREMVKANPAVKLALGKILARARLDAGRFK